MINSDQETVLELRRQAMLLNSYKYPNAPFAYTPERPTAGPMWPQAVFVFFALTAVTIEFGNIVLQLAHR